MSLSKHKEMPSYDFPEDLLSEIFKRLPVKYVLRCRAVQKSWYHLIKTPMFISLHSNHQKITAHINPKYLLFYDTNTHVMKVHYDDAQCQEYCTFDYPLDLPKCSWHAQSNGLMCMSNMFGYDPDIYIWNPLVQKFKTVPDSPLSTFTCKEIMWKALAFGFLPEVNDYVVVHIVKPKSTSAPISPKFLSVSDKVYEQYPHSVMIGVYSLNSNSWKKICQDKVFVDSMTVDQSVFVNGTAFWAGFVSGEINQLVVFFNTKTNILRIIMLPHWIIRDERQLYNHFLPYGQSISYFLKVDEEDADEDDEEDCYPHMRMWVLKDEMIGFFSWEKKMSFSLSDEVWTEVLGIRNNGEPIQAELNDLISYDLDTHQPYDFVESCDRLAHYSYSAEGLKLPFVISPFVETLVLLDID